MGVQQLTQQLAQQTLQQQTLIRLWGRLSWQQLWWQPQERDQLQWCWRSAKAALSTRKGLPQPGEAVYLQRCISPSGVRATCSCKVHPLIPELLAVQDAVRQADALLVLERPSRAPANQTALP